MNTPDYKNTQNRPYFSCGLHYVGVFTRWPMLNNDVLFDLLIMSLFLYGMEIWGAAYQGKYLDRIDKPVLEASVQIRIHQQPVCNSWSYQKSRL